MAKRVADNYLTHDNWDKEDKNVSDDNCGGFQQADQDVLKRRVIKKARRRVADQQNQELKTGAFAGFGGLTAPSASAGFKGFQAQPSSNISTPAFTGFSNGTKSATNNNKINITKPEVKSETKTDGPQNQSEYNRHLAALNKSVSEWISSHVTKNPMCDLTPVFRDYKKHLNQIEEKYASSQSESSQSDTQEKKTTEKQFKLTGFDPPPSTNITKIPQSTSAIVEKPSFGGFSTTGTSSPFKGFQLGSQSKPNTGFTFGSSMVSSNKDSNNETSKPDADKEKTDEDYVPPKAESSEIVEENSIYTSRCKLFYKKGESFADRGVGNVYLKKDGDKTQLLVRADTTLGNILLNILLQPELPVSRMGKNNVMLSCIPNPPIDNKESEVTPMLIRVKTSEDADELLKLIEENKKS